MRRICSLFPFSRFPLTDFICDYNIGTMADILGTFEQAVLLAIVRLEDDAYGRGILREVQERLSREVAAGAVHATLERLEAKGLVRSRMGTGTPIRDGRARRFYRLSSAGVAALNEARTTLKTLWQGIRFPLTHFKLELLW